jgi:hypothetical protein
MNLLLILTFIFIWVSGSIRFDGFIKYQYENYQDEWLDDGKPRGMFFNPKESSYLYFWIQTFTLYRGIPMWAEDDAVAIKKYGKIQFWAKITKIYLILFFPALIFSAWINS